MSKFISAYDTLAGSARKKSLEKTKEALALININGQYVQDDNNSQLRRLYTHDVLELPIIPHPVVIDEQSEHSILYVDLRSFTHLDQASGDYIIKLNNEAVLEINRALLNAIWVEKNAYVLLNLSPLPMLVFASWVSETVARRFALTPKEQLTLAIYSSYYYYSLFSENEKMDDEDLNRVIASISKNLRASSMDVIEVLDRVPETLSGVGQFCELMPEVVGSIRLKDFNHTLLFQLVGGAWFGLNARELVAVSLEHIPSWIALVHAAFSERTYRNTQLSKLCERKASRAQSDAFIRSVFNLLTNQ